MDAMEVDEVQIQIDDTPSTSSAVQPLVKTEEEKKHEKQHGKQKPFTIKKYNLVAVWSWDVECDTCAICRVQLMEACLRCQAENKKTSECVAIWGECNHCFHLCCMSYWVKQNNRCPLCQQDWQVQRVGQ